MSTRKAFEMAIEENPYDETTRRIFADWLEEFGDQPNDDDRAVIQRAWTREKYDEAKQFLHDWAKETYYYAGIDSFIEFLEDLLSGRKSGLPFETSDLRDMIDNGLWDYYEIYTGNPVNRDTTEELRYVRCSC